VETQPGLDTFISDPGALKAEALQPLLDWAAAVVPARQHGQVGGRAAAAQGCGT
jgi:hypothetical protein